MDAIEQAREYVKEWGVSPELAAAEFNVSTDSVKGDKADIVPSRIAGPALSNSVSLEKPHE